ncbi:MBL fold metallo-hydrolase [Candidatus Electronema sp. JM]|uniref:MBL fold metallo-hydrolase n=1 Tax=Candidatus Electronema sp. JM TaxID=3401571 RepID=UPI003AA83654
MKFCILGSGSKGNCTLVESGATSVLLDAGFSGKEIKRRLGLIGRSVEDITAILLTHEHGDHISGAGVLSRQARLPIYANSGTHRAAEAKLGSLHQRTEFGTGEGFRVDGLAIHPFRISHDTADPVGFVLSDGSRSLCCCTDTGKITALIRQTARRCHALILEANYDPQLLAAGPYPLPVQQRVRSSQGHLANSAAAKLLGELTDAPLRQVVLAHLSETNNQPDIALAQMEEELRPHRPSFTIDIAEQARPTRLFEV